MFRKMLGMFLLMGNVVAWGVEVPSSRFTVEGKGLETVTKYVPLLLSNGSLTYHLDASGSQRHSAYLGVYRAGRRYESTYQYALVSLGWLEESLWIEGKEYKTGEKWSQRLNPRQGWMESELTFPGVKQEMLVFTPLEEDLMAIRRVLISTSDKPLPIRAELRYHMTANWKTDQLPKRLRGAWRLEEQGNAAFFDYEFFGHPDSQGQISVWGEGKTTSRVEGHSAVVAYEGTLAPGERKEVIFYVLHKDTLDGDHYRESAQESRRQIQAEGFAKRLKLHEQAWDAYWQESFVDIPDEAIQRMYETGQYHLRANATKWSFPVGNLPRLWSGRYFGWDEMFIHQGLLTGNHLEIARRCPEFRRAILDVATYRVAHNGKKGKFGAKYVWESLEDGSDGTPPGFWNDHIFHMANIALSAWTQYLYSHDREYLEKTGYPVILECARYFLSHWVYEDSNGEMYLGKCTDLERLGPAKDYPFMTTCGAVYAMRAAAKGAELLGMNLDEAAKFRRVADKLVESLPVKDGVYIGHRGCTEPTVATLSGIFPYDIFDADHPLQRATAYKFLLEGRSHANMYPVGNSICPWYAGKMAITMTALEDNVYPAKLLREAADSCGYFGELYEINEEKVSFKPWFATAAGNCVQAIHQMLVFCREKEVRLCYGVPEDWKAFSFLLPIYGGMQVQCEIQEGRVVMLQIFAPPQITPQEKVLVIPEKFLVGVPVADAVISRREIRNGKIYLTVPVAGNITVVGSSMEKGLRNE